MKRFKSTLMGLLFAVVAVVSVMVSAGTANASSDYDGVLVQTSTLKVANDGDSCTTDLTDTWEGVISAGLSTSDRASFLNKAAWVVTEYSWTEEEDMWTTEVQVHWWEPRDLPAVLTFQPENPPYSNRKVLMTNGGQTATVQSHWLCNAPIVGGADISTQQVIGYQGSSATYKIFEASGVELVYPAGYAGEALDILAPPTNPTYVAMGDSFSSGEGAPAPDFEAGTDPGCHRSPVAYPRRLIQNSDLENYGIGYTAFVACSGATTLSLTSTGQYGEPAQIDSLSDDTQIVTLSLGGNDVGFSDYVSGCLVTCGPDNPVGAAIYGAMLDGINAPAFKSNLMDAYESVLLNAPNAQVYVVDYPYVSKESVDTTSSECVYIKLYGTRDVEVRLNTVILTAVRDVDDPRLHLIQTNYEGSPFEGHELCGDNGSYFNNITNPVEYSIHPHAAGQAAYASVIEEYLLNN